MKNISSQEKVIYFHYIKYGANREREKIVSELIDMAKEEDCKIMSRAFVINECADRIKKE